MLSLGQILEAHREIIKSGLSGRLLMVGDASLCVRGLPCKARDVDYSGTTSLLPIIEDRFNVEWIEKRKEYPFHGEGMIVHTRIKGVPVDFNLESRTLWLIRYSGSQRIVYNSGLAIRTYSLERYLAGRMRRLAMMKAKGQIDKMPQEVMDTVPVYCLARTDRSSVAFWRRRVMAADFCPDREVVDRAGKLSEKELGVKPCKKYVEGLYKDSGCEDCWRCSWEIRHEVCGEEAVSVAEDVLASIPHKYGGGPLLEALGYNVYMRDLDIFVPAELHRDSLPRIRWNCFVRPGCRVVVSNSGRGEEFFAGCCWLDIIPLPRSIYNYADTVEYYVASNAVNLKRSDKHQWRAAKILAKFMVLYFQGLFSDINWDRVREISMLMRRTGFEDRRPIQVSQEAVEKAIILYYYVYTPPSHMVHVDIENPYLQATVRAIVELLNREIYGYISPHQ